MDTGLLFTIYTSRSINLTEALDWPTPIYYYSKGAEAPIVQLIQSETNAALRMALEHHFYTNLAVSYPDAGFGRYVREMWDLSFNLSMSISTFDFVKSCPQFFSSPFQIKLISESDVSLDAFCANPREILPHFMVPGHPLSVKLMEQDKLNNSFLGK